MLFFTEVLTLVLAISLSPFASARVVSNFTLGTYERRATKSIAGSYQTCAKVSGTWSGYSYNFGCLCLDDLDEYCSKNNIASSLKTIIKSSISSKGSEEYYPDHAQPTCDGSGGYTCSALTRQSNGACSSSTCDSSKTSVNGGCCARGMTYSNGKCCGSVGCKLESQTCSAVLSCSTYSSNGICCPSGTSGYTGYSTVCCPAGKIEDGSTGTCISSCSSGYTYSSSKGKCEANCDTSNGYTSQTTTSGSDICCQKNYKACATVCCPSSKSEVGSTGVCCASGSTVSDGKCTTPTGTSHRRRSAGKQIGLGSLGAVPFFGLEANSDGSLCPKGFAACPISSGDSSYECLDPVSDLQSCGGCASLRTGMDCTTIPGVKWMGCNQGTCEVYSCKRGWKRNANGTSCERS